MKFVISSSGARVVSCHRSSSCSRAFPLEARRCPRVPPLLATSSVSPVNLEQPALKYGFNTLGSSGDEGSDEELATLGWRRDLADVIEVGKAIGAGSFGQVRVGTMRHSGQKVAVKTMAKIRGKLSSVDTLAKILAEAEMLRRVEGCPCTVRLWDCFEDKCNVHMVMELCQGGDLKKYVEENGPLPEAALAVVAFEILKFLQACHERGIIYADVKPANFCLVEAEPFVNNGERHVPGHSYLKAIDMGSSQLVQPDTGRLHKRHGTMVFMAPELMAANYSFKADVWSLGMSLYWMYCDAFPYWPIGGEPPLVRIDIMEELAGSLTLDLHPPSVRKPWAEMSLEGRDFISRCLRVSEAERLSVEEALDHAWVKHLADEDACAGVQCTLPLF